MFAYRATTIISLALGVTGCAIQKATPSKDATGRVGEAVVSPFSDLNLVQRKIPEALIHASANPYVLPGQCSCDALVAEINALQEVLDDDFDMRKEEESLLNRSTNEVGDAAIGAIKDVATGWMPYRSWVRKLTGAEKHSKEVAKAIAAGTVRRAYLKGLGQAKGCEPPAAPSRIELPAPPANEAVVKTVN